MSIETRVPRCRWFEVRCTDYRILPLSSEKINTKVVKKKGFSVTPGDSIIEPISAKGCVHINILRIVKDLKREELEKWLFPLRVTN